MSFTADDQSQDSEQELDPMQAMIQQALASAKDQPASQPTQVAAAEPVERPSLGERIGAKAPAPVIKVQQPPSAPSPGPVLPSGSSAALNSVVGDMTDKTAPPPPSPNLGGLITQQAQLGKVIDPKTIDPQTGKPKYKMGWGQRLLGIAANFGAGLNHQGPVQYLGPGATNRQYDVDEDTRKKNLENVNTQIGTQKDLAEENRKLYEASTQGQQREVAGQVAQMKADISGKLAEIANNKEKDTIDVQRGKLDNLADQLSEKARRDDQLNALGQGNLAARQQNMELMSELRRMQLENDKDKFAKGADQKSLEAERKARIDSINKEWAKKSWLQHTFGSPQKEIDFVNSDVDAKLKNAGIGTSGQAAAPASNAPAATATPAPQTHVFSKGVWSKANPGKDVNAAAAFAQKKGFQVAP